MKGLAYGLPRAYVLVHKVRYLFELCILPRRSAYCVCSPRGSKTSWSPTKTSLCFALAYPTPSPSSRLRHHVIVYAFRPTALRSRSAGFAREI